MNRTSPGQTCKNCKFWTPPAANMNVGQCRRYPPQRQVIYKADIQHYDVSIEFPILPSGEWCGEWQEDALTQASREYYNSKANLERLEPK